MQFENGCGIGQTDCPLKSEGKNLYGWRGKILRVDLTSGKIKEENLDPKVARVALGGRGIGVHYLLKRRRPHLRPSVAENMMIMAAGPLTGTPPLPRLPATW